MRWEHLITVPEVPGTIPATRELEAGDKYTGSLAVREVTKRRITAGHCGPVDLLPADEGSIPTRSPYGATESVRCDIGRAHDELRQETDTRYCGGVVAEQSYRQVH